MKLHGQRGFLICYLLNLTESSGRWFGVGGWGGGWSCYGNPRSLILARIRAKGICRAILRDPMQHSSVSGHPHYSASLLYNRYIR
jgi:hypothetical protein